VPILRPASPEDASLAAFRDVSATDQRLREGRFLVEGRLVVRRLLTESAYRTHSVLVSEAAFEALADVLAPRAATLPIQVVPTAWMRAVTGFNLHRGCLAIGERGPDRPWRPLASSARRLLLLEGVGNPDNVGGLFRTARAFGVDAILVGPGTGDPLYRKAVRVSCGAALVVPWARAAPWPAVLEQLGTDGVAVWALTPRADAVSIHEACAAGVPARLALLLGAEGPGLSEASLSAASLHVRIPIDPGADSLNVNVAAGVALATVGSREALRERGNIGT
jgi:tRNA G18 (ribose-2'-O)-methylase SpoU